MSKTEFKIGEVFQCGLVKLRCVKATNLCDGCVFYFYNEDPLKKDCSYIALGNCVSCYRKDKTNVIFKKAK